MRPPVEAREQLSEFPGRASLREPGGAPDVREECGHLDLGASRLLVNGSDAHGAEAAIQRGWPAADKAQEEAAGPPEGSQAELATRF